MDQLHLLWEYQKADVEVDKVEASIRRSPVRQKLVKYRDLYAEQQNAMKRIESEVATMQDRLEALKDAIRMTNEQVHALHAKMESEEPVHAEICKLDAGTSQRAGNALQGGRPHRHQGKRRSRQAGEICVSKLILGGYIMDEENWEMNAIAFGEVICRKLRKLGAVFSVGGYYHSADRPPYRIDPYGTAWVIAHDGQDLDKVGRVILDNFPYAKTFYPDRPKGEWIEREDWDGDNYYECSVCGESFVLIDGTPSMNLYHYCPNCGAKME